MVMSRNNLMHDRVSGMQDLLTSVTNNQAYQVCETLQVYGNCQNRQKYSEVSKMPMIGKEELHQYLQPPEVPFSFAYTQLKAQF